MKYLLSLVLIVCVCAPVEAGHHKHKQKIHHKKHKNGSYTTSSSYIVR